MTDRGRVTREGILSKALELVMERGFAGTSLDEVLKACGVSKGAFFYHFKSKADLGEALLDYYLKQDLGVFAGLSKRADELSTDPLQSTLIFLKLFEEFIASLDAPHPGCLLASYVYEHENFDPCMTAKVQEGFREWGKMYEQRFTTLIAQRPPKHSVEAKELAELIMSIIQGAFILAKSLQDREVIVRSARHFRHYLELLWASSQPH